MGVKEKPDIIDIIEKKRLQWYGHVKRMQEESLSKLIMEWIPEERRKRGRPNKRGWKAYEQPWKQDV
jgi:IS5 family transposase